MYDERVQDVGGLRFTWDGGGGARVYQTDSWGIQGPEGRIDSPAYNTTNFTGESPWGGGNLEMVDTRAEYERYIANR